LYGKTGKVAKDGKVRLKKDAYQKKIELFHLCQLFRAIEFLAILQNS